MRKVVADTNFVIAVMFKDHEFHERAIKDWEGIERAYLPIIALSELAYFLIRNKLRTDVIKAVISDPKIEVVENTLDDVLYAIKESPKSYDDFNDYMIVSTAKRLGLEVLTYDEKLRRKLARP